MKTLSQMTITRRYKAYLKYFKIITNEEQHDSHERYSDDVTGI